MINLSNKNGPLKFLLFNEMTSKDEDNLLTAKECIVGLYRVSKKREAFRGLQQYLTEQIGLLRGNIDAIAQADDVMVAEVYQDVFIDFCKMNVTQIIEEEDSAVL